MWTTGAYADFSGYGTCGNGAMGNLNLKPLPSPQSGENFKDARKFDKLSIGYINRERL
jgi:hypothetical protein